MYAPSTLPRLPLSASSGCMMQAGAWRPCINRPGPGDRSKEAIGVSSDEPLRVGVKYGMELELTRSR